MKPQVAIVHDYLVDTGGAERVVIALHELYPDAPIFTSVLDPKSTFADFKTMRVQTSFLQRFPINKSNYKLLLPLFPIAFERFDLSEYDIIISSASAFAKGVKARTDSLHVCYCHTPPRFAWRLQEYLEMESMRRIKQFLLLPIIHYLRSWDFAAAQRVHHFIANSQLTARRIAENYRRQSTVIVPPVQIQSFAPSPNIGDYYLITSRLVPYKRIDVAIQAFNKLGLPLKIAGIGVDEMRLRKMAGNNIEFLGHVTLSHLAELYAHARAIIFPGIEDFGIVPLEANASGRPVIAFAAGGALETVIDGVTGKFFNEQLPDALAEVVATTDVMLFDPMALRGHAEKFSKMHFKHRISEFIDEIWHSR
jgi:glycosyltransferase involved in cell wall biosynthesis